MKTISSLLFIAIFMVSCEKNRDTNDMNGNQDSLNVETNTIPMYEDESLDTLNTDRTEVKGTTGSIPTAGTSTINGSNNDGTINSSGNVDSINTMDR